MQIVEISEEEPVTTWWKKIDTWILQQKERILIWTSLGCLICSVLSLIINTTKK